MDPFTHAILGATAASLACPKPNERRAAAFMGALGGLLPDLDVLIQSDGDPLMALEYHRHFTHALIFAPLGGFLGAVVMRKLMKKHLGFWWSVLFCIIGWAVHGPLDACTNYGTHLFWPFLERRESWNVISIIDPLFTIPLLIGLIATLATSFRRPVLIGAVYALCYLAFGYLQKERAETALHHIAMERGDVIDRQMVSPSLGNFIVWNGIYQTHDVYHIEAFRITTAGTVMHLASDTAPALTDAARGNLVPVDSVQARDLERFRFFADGWLAPMPGGSDILADMRFTRLPGKAMPLWGIELDPDAADQHAARVNLKGGGRNLGLLWQMILGNPAPSNK